MWTSFGSGFGMFAVLSAVFNAHCVYSFPCFWNTIMLINRVVSSRSIITVLMGLICIQWIQINGTLAGRACFNSYITFCLHNVHICGLSYPLICVSNSQGTKCRTMRCQHVSITESILMLFLNRFKNILLHYLFIFCSHVGNNACLIET